MDFFRIQFEPTNVKPDTIFALGSLEVTNAILMGVLLVIMLTVFSLIVRNKLSLIPGKLQNIVELAVEGMSTLVEQITGDKRMAEKLLPLIGTIFVFFTISNLITLIPGISSFTYNGVPLFRGPTNDFNMTFSVAFGVVILSQLMSIKTFGLLGHLGKYFKFKELVQGFKKSMGDGFVALIDFFIGLLDIVSELAKVFSLSLRLFGNMFAGELLLALLMGTFAIGIPSIWLGMNLLVGIIQAIVFGALSTAYYMMAVQQAEAESH